MNQARQGARIEQRSKNHFTALHHAAMRGHVGVVAVLASLSADVSAVTLQGVFVGRVRESCL